MIAKLKLYWPGFDLVLTILAFGFALRGSIIGDDTEFFGWCTLGFLLLILTKLEDAPATIVVNVKGRHHDR